MEQYIPKSAVVAEIESLLDKGRYHEEYDCAYRDGNNDALQTLKDKLNTLEVKESNFKDIKSVFEGQYISKDKVVTTIERLQDECEEQGDNNGVELLEKLFNKIDSLEVKEVDIEKEIKEVQRNYKTIEEYEGYPCTMYANNIEWIAKHFFELGFKTSQKGEKA